MELKEIKETVTGIINDIGRNKSTRTSCKYDSFLERIGMGNRRNFEILEKFDYQFKKHNVSLWSNKELVKSIIDFRKGDTVTFRKEQLQIINNTTPLPATTTKFQFAGSIKIANEESGLTLYKHQEEAIEKLQDKIIKTNKTPFAGLLVLPTGGGKTLTAAYWIAKNFLDKNKKVLWIAHRHELLEQAQLTFHHRLAFKDVFQKKSTLNYRIISGIHDRPVNIQPTDDIIISSKDSLIAGFEHLNKNWLKHNDNEILLVIDEAHHATAKTYRTLIKNLKGKSEKFRMIGLTATPFRTAEDEQGLLSKVFPDDIIYKVDLRTLISRGILSEPIFEEERTGFDMTKYLDDKQIDDLKYFDIDSIGKDIAKTIAENNERNCAIVNRYVKNKSKYKQTIVFALNQANAIALKKLFEESKIKADFVVSSIKDMATGVTLSAKENKEKIDRFRKGKLDVLINVNILTEGTDLPNVQSIFLARPTISSILMTQMMGRGLRGQKAGGTKEAYIVSFIDEWRDKVAWVNPEKLLIEANTNFNDKQLETRKQLIRLVSINKIEEFAILTNKNIDKATREELEKLDFIERLPLGIYHFSILQQIKEESIEKNCEILVYDNISQSYQDFINGLPDFFAKNNLSSRDYLTPQELDKLSKKVEQQFFHGCLKYPAYLEQDIKDILQYYAQKDIEPQYVELKDREKYDITKVAQRILDSNMGSRDVIEYKNNLWDNNEVEWKAFFGYDKRYFLNEIDLAIRKLSNPDLFKKTSIIPQDDKELRELEKLSMGELREQFPQYWKQISDTVYERQKDKNGYYFCAITTYRSKNKLDFQIDHIIPISEGGPTVLDNLQLLERKAHAEKGTK